MGSVVEGADVGLFVCALRGKSHMGRSEAVCTRPSTWNGEGTSCSIAACTLLLQGEALGWQAWGYRELSAAVSLTRKRLRKAASYAVLPRANHDHSSIHSNSSSSSGRSWREQARRYRQQQFFTTSATNREAGGDGIHKAKRRLISFW